MKNHFSEKKSGMVRVGGSRLRVAWLRGMAWLEDHPRTALVFGVGVLGLILFYVVVLNGFAFGVASFERWRVESFGGVLERGRSIQLADPVIALRPRDYDRLDAIALGSNYIGINAFDEEMNRVLAQPGARIRIVGLDPRLGDPGHPEHARFEALARAYGAEPWEYGARCWHAAATLLRIQQRLAAGRGGRLEIRLVSKPLPGAVAPYWDSGRSAHLYHQEKPGDRLDIIIPRPVPPTGTDSLTHPGRMILDRPQDPDVHRFSEAFERAWDAAEPLESTLHDTLLHRLDGSVAPGNQP